MLVITISWFRCQTFHYKLECTVLFRSDRMVGRNGYLANISAKFNTGFYQQNICTMASFDYTTTGIHFAAIFVMQICVTHERFFSKEKLKVCVCVCVCKREVLSDLKSTTSPKRTLFSSNNEASKHQTHFLLYVSWSQAQDTMRSHA